MAGRIPESFIDEVRSSVNIVDVISQYVSLEKKGKDYVGLCPFHQEKTPSFTVSESKQFFKCFGCGRGGNVFKFLMDKDNLTFPESVERVAQMAHIAMPAGYDHQVKPLSPLKKVQAQANTFFHHVLMNTQVGQRALDYANTRGLDTELLEHFQIGYAPDSQDLLLKYLKGKGFAETDLVKSGLFAQSQDGRLFDRFRDRLMFPLTDELGQIVGFSGRRLSNDKEIAKYLNSPETEIFTKSKVLFHFAEARKESRKEKHLVLYEGYMDVIAGYKAGVKSGIASMGTSLTDEQVYMLRRVTPNIILNYDGDAPGVHAMERATRLFDKAGHFNLGIVVLPDNLDPDEYVKKYGIDKYQNAIKNAISTTDFLLNQASKKYNFDNDREKLAYIDEAINLIAHLPDPVARDLYLVKLTKQTDVSKDSLKVSLIRASRKLRRVQQHVGKSPYEQKVQESNVPSQVQADIPNINNRQLLRLLYLFIHSEQARDYLLKKHFLFPDENYAKLAEYWLNFIETHDNISINSFLDFIPEQLQGIIVNMEMAPMPQEFSQRELDDQINSLAQQHISQQIRQLLNQLQEAKAIDDQARVLKITQQILTLKRSQS